MKILSWTPAGTSAGYFAEIEVNATTKVVYEIMPNTSGLPEFKKATISNEQYAELDKTVVTDPIDVDGGLLQFTQELRDLFDAIYTNLPK